MSGFNPVTRSGYNFHHVISALQKEIRRGNEREALYWALELEVDPSKAAGTRNWEIALLRRLLVIAHEDIGIANPIVFTAIPEMIRCYAMLRERNNGGARLILTNMILLLCRSPKSRISDEFLAVVMKDRNGPKREIPDYALDQHTAAGRAKGRVGAAGEAHFHENCLLIPLADLTKAEKSDRYPGFLNETERGPSSPDRYRMDGVVFNPYKDAGIDAWMGGVTYQPTCEHRGLNGIVDPKGKAVGMTLFAGDPTDEDPERGS